VPSDVGGLGQCCWWRRRVRTGGYPKGTTCQAAPPRRRPGPNWETLLTKDDASLLPPCELGPGLRRGGGYAEVVPLG
jgi:hypothetical protein